MPSEAKLQPVAQQLCGATSDPEGLRPGATCTWGKGHLSPVHHDDGYLWVDPAEFPAFAAEKELREKAEAEWERHTQDAEASRAAFKAAQELIRMNNEAMAKESSSEELNGWKRRAEAAEAALAALTASQLEDIRDCYKSAGEPYLAERKKYALAKALEVPLAICDVTLVILGCITPALFVSALLGKGLNRLSAIEIVAVASAITVLWQSISTYRKAMAESRDTTKGGR